MNEHKLIEQLNESHRVIDTLIEQLHAKDEQIANLTSSLKSVTDMCDEMRAFIQWLEAEGCCDYSCDNEDDCECCECEGCYGPDCPDFPECECHGAYSCYGEDLDDDESCDEDEYDEDCCLCEECQKKLAEENDDNTTSKNEAESLEKIENMIRAEVGEEFKHFKRTRTVKEDGSVEYTWLKEVNL